MAISPAVAHQPTVSGAAPAEEPPVGPHRELRLVVLGVLVVALLASAGCLLWLLAERQGVAEKAQRERDAVLRQTERFVLRLNTYGPDQLDDQGHLTEYRQRVDEVITAKFAADFDKSGLPFAEQTVAQAGYGRTAEIYGSGVESIDADSAVALVAAGFRGSYPDPQHRKDPSKRVETGPDVLRWQVDLVRTDDGWLVDDYRPVSEEEQ